MSPGIPLLMCQPPARHRAPRSGAGCRPCPPRRPAASPRPAGAPPASSARRSPPCPPSPTGPASRTCCTWWTPGGTATAGTPWTSVGCASACFPTENLGAGMNFLFVYFDVFAKIFRFCFFLVLFFPFFSPFNSSHFLLLFFILLVCFFCIELLEATLLPVFLVSKDRSTKLSFVLLCLKMCQIMNQNWRIKFFEFNLLFISPIFVWFMHTFISSTFSPIFLQSQSQQQRTYQGRENWSHTKLVGTKYSPDRSDGK